MDLNTITFISSIIVSIITVITGVILGRRKATHDELQELRDKVMYLRDENDDLIEKNNRLTGRIAEVEHQLDTIERKYHRLLVQINP